MVGPRFPTPWRLVFHSHGTVASCFLPYFPCSAAFATRRCPFPLCHILTLAKSPCLSPDSVFIPHRAASNLIARAHWILIHPEPFGASCTGRSYPAPLCSGCVFVLDSLGTLCGPCHTFFLARSPYPIPLPAPIPHQASCIPCVYPTQPHARLWRLPAGPLLASCTDSSYLFFCCLLARCCVSSGGVFMFFLFFLLMRTPWVAPPPFPSVCPCAVQWFPVASVFFLTSSLHARTSPLHRSSGYGPPLFSSLVFSPPRGVPLGGIRPSQVGASPSRHPPLHPLPSPLPALPPSPVSRPSPLLLLSCPVCAALLLSAPGESKAQPSQTLQWAIRL